MLSTYTPLLKDSATRRFMIGSAIGRLGGAMFGMSLVAMISTRTGSFALAGAVSATGLVILALTAVVAGRLTDRFGQRRVTYPLLIWSSVWCAVMVAASALEWPTWTLFGAYAMATIVANLGTLSRARWAHKLRDEPNKLHTSMSLEQVVDELSFVLGPALAIALATLWFPEAGYIAAALFYLVGTLIFLSDRSTEPPVDEVAHHGSALAIRTPGILILTCVLFMTGAIFGSNEVTAIAVAKDQGNPSASGLIVALFAVGSAAAGLWFGSRTLTRSLQSLLVVGTAGMFLLEAPILLTEHLVPIALVMMVAGAATAPTLIISMQLAQKLVPSSQVNEAMSVVLTGLIIGIAAGSALSGIVIEQVRPHAGFWVPVAAGGIALLLAVAGRAFLRRKRA